MTSILILGGTGFVGKSLVSFLESNSHDAVVIARSGNNDVFDSKSSHDNYRNVVWDIREKSTLNPDFDVIVHAATPASALLNALEPHAMLQLIVKGMENVIEFASRYSEPPKILFTSSGAVYGEVPSSVNNIAEDFPVASDLVGISSAYAKGKLLAESILRNATLGGVCHGLIARLFAFSGENLPRDRHFAIGNFVEDAVNKNKIVIRSNGSSIRSYLDQHDMAHWLISIAQNGIADSTYHVGSERAISIRDLAFLVSERCEMLTGESIPVEILGQTSQLDGVTRYVPSTLRTRLELGLSETITLESSIDRMLQAAITAQS